MVEAELRRDDLPEGGRIETLVRKEGDARSYVTRIVGGHFDGDEWESETRREAMRTHADNLAIYGTERS